KKGPQRSDVNDPPVLALDHVTSENLARAQCAGEVRIHQAVPIGFEKVQRGGAQVESGGIYQDIDSSKFRERGSEQVFERFAIGNIAGNAKGPASPFFDFTGDDFNLVHAAPGWNNVGACFGEAARQCLADSRGSTNDDGYLIVQLQPAISHMAS